jgi:hypothetical protein
MKKIAILFVMMFAVALWFGSTASAGTPPPHSTSSDTDDKPTPNQEDCGDNDCDSDWSDIEFLSAESDSGDGGIITVILDLCADADQADETEDGEGSDDPDKEMVKYRIHIDHHGPNTDDGPYATDNHEFATPDNECGYSDTGAMYRFHKKRGKASKDDPDDVHGKVYGPADVDVDSDEITFEFAYADLFNPGGGTDGPSRAVQAGDTVHIWADTQNHRGGGLCDRAPNTDVDSGCSDSTEPDHPDEVLSIVLD